MLIEMNCLNCNKKFKVKPSRLKRQKTFHCSYKCKGESRRGKTYEGLFGIEKSNKIKEDITKNNAHYWKGKHRSEETKMKNSLNCRRYQTLETRKKISRSMIGIKKTIEHIKNISKGSIGKKLSEETKKKLRLVRMTQKIPTHNTSIELKLYKELENRGIPFQKYKPISNITQPDAFIEPNICIYADGDYWHNLRNIREKDIKINEKLKQKGYIILRFWEHEINDNVKLCVDLVQKNLGHVNPNTTQRYIQYANVDLTHIKNPLDRQFESVSKGLLSIQST